LPWRKRAFNFDSRPGDELPHGSHDTTAAGRLNSGVPHGVHVCIFAFRRANRPGEAMLHESQLAADTATGAEQPEHPAGSAPAIQAVLINIKAVFIRGTSRSGRKNPWRGRGPVRSTRTANPNHLTFAQNLFPSGRGMAAHDRTVLRLTANIGRPPRMLRRDSTRTGENRRPVVQRAS